jgi:hypothetical protein
MAARASAVYTPATRWLGSSSSAVAGRRDRQAARRPDRPRTPRRPRAPAARRIGNAVERFGPAIASREPEGVSPLSCRGVSSLYCAYTRESRHSDNGNSLLSERCRGRAARIVKAVNDCRKGLGVSQWSVTGLGCEGTPTGLLCRGTRFR